MDTILGFLGRPSTTSLLLVEPWSPKSGSFLKIFIPVEVQMSFNFLLITATVNSFCQIFL